MAESVKNQQLKEHTKKKHQHLQKGSSFYFEVGDGEIGQLGNTLAKFVIQSYPKWCKHETYGTTSKLK